MEGLKTILVFLDAPIASKLYWKWSKPEVLATIKDAGTWKVEDFELKASWPQSSRQKPLEDLPFWLVRILGGPTAQGDEDANRVEQ